MFKKLATMSLVIFLFLLAYAIQAAESQEDYGYVLGVWENTLTIAAGKIITEITVKEIIPVENKAVVFAKWPELKSGKFHSAAGSFEVNDALFKPGPEPVIEFKNPVNGRETTLKFNKNGTGTSKTAATSGGGAGATNYGDLKKMKQD
jgi:hypothetical protein